MVVDAAEGPRRTAAFGSCVVSWDTLDAFLPIGALLRVAYGLEPHALKSVAVGRSSTTFLSPTVFHRVDLTGLTPATLYYYTVLHQNVTAVAYYTFTARWS